MKNFTIRDGFPRFQDLPWEESLVKWPLLCTRLEDVQRGISRHPVVFVNYEGDLYAIKELPPDIAENEYRLLLIMQDQRLPSVIPVGYGNIIAPDTQRSVLITSYLEKSLPYRSLFLLSSLERYRNHLLDAMAGLLVQLHLAGIYWGDCSLSNTLFRRDAGALQAYLVDAETAEYQPHRLSPIYRHQDLQIMEENVNRDLAELEESGSYIPNQTDFEIEEYIRVRYRALWEEVTHIETIPTNEHYRVQERIRALNSLGFSVRDVEMIATDQGDQLHIRILVTDRNFHRNQLLELTGIESEEMQSRQIMNEIHELRAYLAQSGNRAIPLSVAAYHWLQHTYLPTIELLKPSVINKNRADANNDLVELYCQVLEHKWYLSESAQRDVGHQAAVEDYVKRFSPHAS
jgi:DNA-binding transcriptional MerR regulator